MNEKLEILKMVASGEISPEEALNLIEAVDQTEKITLTKEVDEVETEEASGYNGTIDNVKRFKVALIASRINFEKSNVDDVTIEILDGETRALMPKPDWLIFSEEGDLITIKEKRPQGVNDLIEFIKNSAQILKQKLFINIKLPMSTVIGEAEVSCVSGNISLIGISGYDFNLKNVSGNIQIAQVKASRLTVNATSGTIVVDDVTCSQGSYTATSGKIKVKGKHNKIHLNNVSGTIDYTELGDVKIVNGQLVSGKMMVYVPKPEKYDLSIEAVTGSIDPSGFGVVNKEMSGRKRVVQQGKSDDYKIRLKAISGEILLDSSEHGL